MTDELLKRDRDHVWHPFTQSGMNFPHLPVARAHAANLYLDGGSTLIDGISSWWCCIHGHCQERLASAAAQQFRTLDHVIFAGFTHEPAVALAEDILAVLPPGYSKVFYTDNGSTAVEAALKMAIQFWYNRGTPKLGVIALEDSYHGDTFGAMAAGARSIFSAPFENHLYNVQRVTIDGSQATLEYFRSLCATQSIAAFIFEPLVQGAGGMCMYSATTLDSYLAIAREYNIVCIADEVMTGFGRTGPLFASSCLQHSPDIICLSKGLTSGTLPLAITACSTEIFNAFISSDHSKTFFHGHTYTANPIACAVARESLKILLEPDCSAARARIEKAHRVCAEKLRGLKHVINPRVTGTILAFDVAATDAPGYTSNIGRRAYDFFIERGVLLRPLGNVIYCMPPFCISDEELARCHHAMIEFVLTVG
jgi:adenosylmethionine-8-amino-7-oxononanoate aminotransferase